MWSGRVPKLDLGPHWEMERMQESVMVRIEMKVSFTRLNLGSPGREGVVVRVALSG